MIMWVNIEIIGGKVGLENWNWDLQHPRDKGKDMFGLV